MARCEWCGEKFDPTEAEEQFEDETYMLTYSNLRVTLCGKCAVEAINDKADGVYFETCEKCGKTFDLIEEQSEYDSRFSDCNGTDLSDHWDNGILCADCAIEALQEEQAKYYDD